MHSHSLVLLGLLYKLLVEHELQSRHAEIAKYLSSIPVNEPIVSELFKLLIGLIKPLVDILELGAHPRGFRHACMGWNTYYILLHALTNEDGAWQ